jgi:hypothetical protein
MLKKWWRSGGSGCSSGANDVGQVGDGIGDDAEAVAKVGPEGDGVLLARFLQGQETRLNGRVQAWAPVLREKPFLEKSLYG